MGTRSFFPDVVISGFLGFASVPGSQAEVQAFLQRRLRMFVGVMSGLWLSTWLTDLTSRWVLGAPELFVSLAEHLSRRTTIVHGGMGIALGLLWLALKGRQRSLGLLHMVDAGSTNFQAFAVSLILVWNDPRYWPQHSMMLGLTHMLVARAVLVPSTPARTVMLGCVGNGALLLGTYWLYRNGAPTMMGISNPSSLVVSAAIWSVIGVLATAAISAVIFGLQRQVEAARQLGQYMLEDKIGEGGMGVVYRARHALLRRPTAIKLLPPERAGAAAIARFEREVQLTSRLTHPHTVAVYDYGRTPDGVFYYAMELLDGVDLETLVERTGPMAPGRVASMLRQVAGALFEAHGVGLIHRDVKPANVLLCRRGLEVDFAKILDFGLVRDTQTDDPAMTNVNTLTGTPMYMSPEQIKSTAVDAKSDLYALGATAYFLVTGAPLFAAKTIVEVCSQHLYATPVRPSERLGAPVPASLERLILSCLAKDPAHRPETAAHLIEALDAATDIPRWSAADADRWWRDHASAFTKDVPSSAGPQTVAVDLAARA